MITREESRHLASKAFEDRYVGNCLFSDTELNDMYYHAGYLLREYANNRGNILPSVYDELIFVALVNITKEWDTTDDATFLKNISRKLTGTESLSQKVYKHIVDVINRLSSKNKIFMLDCFKKKYYATTVCQALSPRKSMYSLFDMCWLLYCKDLDQQFIPGDRGIFELVSNKLGAIFGEANDENADITLGSQVYSFMAGIKGIAIAYPDYMCDLLMDVTGTIDKLLSGEAFEKDKYIYKLIEQWWEEKAETLGKEKKRTRTKTREKLALHYSDIRARYIVEETAAKLSVNGFCLENEPASNPVLYVYCDDKPILEREMITNMDGIITTANPLSVSLAELSAETGSTNIRVEIRIDGETVFNSGKDLYRDFILFKNDKETMLSECVPGNYLLFAADIDALKDYPDDIQNASSQMMYNVYAEEGESIQSDRRTVFFSEEKQDRDIWLQAARVRNAVFVCGSDEYRIVKGEAQIAVKSFEAVSDIGLRVNDNIYKLSEFDCDETDDRKLYNITDILEEGIPNKISVFSFSDNKIFAYIPIVRFDSFEAEYDKSFYFGQSIQGSVDFITDTINENKIFSSDDDIEIPTEHGTVLLQPPVLRWRIDDSSFACSAKNQGIWYKDISTSAVLEFSCSGEHTVEACISGESLQKDKGRSNAFKLGQAVYSKLGEKQRLSLTCKIDGTHEIRLADIFLRENISKDALLMHSKKELLWNPVSFIGDKDDVKFELTIRHQNGKAIMVVNPTMNTESFTINTLEGFYTAELAIIGKGFRKERVILLEKAICVGNEKELRFKDKIIRIGSVMLQNRSDEVITQRSYYIDSVKYIGDSDGSSFYSGRMYFYNKDNNKVFLDSMINDDGEYDAVNPVRIELMGARSCWIVFGYGGTIYMILSANSL